MYTSAECRAQAKANLAQAEWDNRNRNRLITAAEAWLFLATQLRPVETVVVPKTFKKNYGVVDRADRVRPHIGRAPAMPVKVATGKCRPWLRRAANRLPYDKHIYKERNLIERFFSKIKHFRRIATRYEKTALSFASMLFLVGAVIWLR